jgi:hypothetical protein
MLIRWVIGFFTAWVILVIIANTIEAIDPLGASNITLLELVLGYHTIAVADPQGGSASGLAMPIAVVQAICDALIFNYDFFTANFITQLVRFIVFVPCTIGMILTLALYIRQVISGK